jgi:nicotinamidase-related amidase
MAPSGSACTNAAVLLRNDREWETWPEHCREGSWGSEIVAELAPGGDDSVIRKIRYDAFSPLRLTTCSGSGGSPR